MKRKNLLTTFLILLIISGIICSYAGVFSTPDELSKSEMDESTGTAISVSVDFLLFTTFKPDNSRTRVNIKYCNMGFTNAVFLQSNCITNISNKDFIYKEPPGYLKNLVILS